MVDRAVATTSSPRLDLLPSLAASSAGSLPSMLLWPLTNLMSQVVTATSLDLRQYIRLPLHASAHV